MGADPLASFPRLHTIKLSGAAVELPAIAGLFPWPSITALHFDETQGTHYFGEWRTRLTPWPPLGREIDVQKLEALRAMVGQAAQLQTIHFVFVEASLADPVILEVMKCLRPELEVGIEIQRLPSADFGDIQSQIEQLTEPAGMPQ